MSFTINTTLPCPPAPTNAAPHPLQTSFTFLALIYLLICVILPLSCARVMLVISTATAITTVVLLGDGPEVLGAIPPLLFKAFMPAAVAVVLLRDVISLRPFRTVTVRSGPEAHVEQTSLVSLMLKPWCGAPLVWSFRCTTQEAQMAFITETCAAFPERKHIFCTDNLPTDKFDLQRVLWFENLYRIFGVSIQPGEEASTRPWMVLERTCRNESTLLWHQTNTMLREVKGDDKYPQNCPVMLLSMTNLFTAEGAAVCGGPASSTITAENAHNAELIIRDAFWGFYRPRFMPPLLFPVNLVLALLWLHGKWIQHTYLQFNYCLGPAKRLSCFYFTRDGRPFAVSGPITLILGLLVALLIYSTLLSSCADYSSGLNGIFVMSGAGLLFHGLLMWFGMVGLSNGPAGDVEYGGGGAGTGFSSGGGGQLSPRPVNGGVVFGFPGQQQQNGAYYGQQGDAYGGQGFVSAAYQQGSYR